MFSHKPSLLVVEKDVHIRLALSIVFGSTGCRVRMAEDGFGALAEMQYEVPDILVSNLDTPGMAGFGLLAAVAHLYPSTKVIAISSKFGGDHVPPGVTADAFHGKGASPRQLVDLVRAMTGQIQMALPWVCRPERGAAEPVRFERRNNDWWKPGVLAEMVS